MKTYNGWINRAAWNVALWVDNDEKLYNNMLNAHKRRVEMGKPKWSANAVKGFCSHYFGGRTPDGDRLQHVGEKGWEQIAESFNESCGVNE